MGYGRHTPTKTGIMEDWMSRCSDGEEGCLGSFGIGLSTLLLHEEGVAGRAQLHEFYALEN